MAVVFDPDMISQFTHDRSLPEHEHLRHQFRPFTQCLDVPPLGPRPGPIRTHHRLRPDPSRARDRIAEFPHLFNQLPVHNGRLKETLRLFPPAASIRAQSDADAAFHLTHPTTGKILPTHVFMLLDSHFTQHRNPRVWHGPAECLGQSLRLSS
ncbi:hypothetical protein N657DRAFT_694192 [Parathielavia appendiculata]|uniref:Uncharacterized protein n=1 Tax=Parathielavia appendiculata TaxID=2587402 RepID=A0AAN6TQJ5_9PEZI|nr:hypothetical protein N657DRAFT_694192 [Parathielavia appendiculata]